MNNKLLEGSPINNILRAKANRLLAQMGFEPKTSHLSSAQGYVPSMRTPTEDLPIVQKKQPEKELKKAAVEPTISKTPIKATSSKKPIKKATTTKKEKPEVVPVKKSNKNIEFRKATRNAQEGYTLHGILHHDYPTPPKQEIPRTMYKVTDDGQISYFSSGWPSGHSIYGNQTFVDTPSGQSKQSSFVLGYPNGEYFQISAQGDDVTVKAGKNEIKGHSNLDIKELAKRLIEKHAWDAHGSVPSDKKTLATDYFHNLGRNAKEWSLPETHPFADINFKP